MELHAVIIHKPITLEKAREIASEFIKNKNRNFYRETKNSYRFRNLPKSRFSNFKSKKINKDITLIYGTPKTGNITGGGFMDKLKDFILRYNPITLVGKALMSGAKQDLQSKGYFQKSNRLPY